jgi:hypothetical protein
MLCSIADVYDAMRSERRYQQSVSIDRVLDVLTRNDGQYFDRNLVDRFVHLVGIYPVGSLVKLNTGDVGVVLKTYVLDLYRPRVRIVIDRAGLSLARPVDVNLWEITDPAGPCAIVTSLDPDRLLPRSADLHLNRQERENKSPTAAGVQLVATLIVGAAMVLALSARGSTQAPPAASEASAPSLLVLIVVDQMRADYVDRFSSDWTGGFNRLITQGAWFKNAAYPYLQTMTCAGHATLATGLFPHTHGIIQNEWPRGNPQQEPLCTDDPMVPDIGYLRPADRRPQRASARRAHTGRCAAHNRKAKVVSLSLKPEAAIMLAGHGGDAIVWFNDRLDALATSSSFTARPVAAVATFAQANPVEAYFRRTWDRVLTAEQVQGCGQWRWRSRPARLEPEFPASAERGRWPNARRRFPHPVVPKPVRRRISRSDGRSVG